MSGGIFEIIKLKRQMDEMEQEKQRNALLLQKLESENDEALIIEAK